MEEDEVKSKLPEIYQSIIKSEEDVDWKQVNEDLQDLRYLEYKDCGASELIHLMWKVIDRWGVSVLQSNPRFKLMKLSKVKIAITTSLYNLQDESEIKQICRESRHKIEEMTFFSCSKSMLYAASDENFVTIALRIRDIFADFRSTLSGYFIHFDNQLKIEINSTIGKLLDETFYNKVLIGLKTKFMQDPSTSKIVNEFEKGSVVYNDVGAGTEYSPSLLASRYNIVLAEDSSDNNSYATSYSNQNSVYLRTNMYYGELNENGKRHGYGKVTYFGGDTYEGYWENDKPHGEGLYSWKIGGKYKGPFVNGAITGQGQRVYSAGNWYTGEFLNGKKHGKGEMRYKNGDFYNGGWSEDQLHGEGIYTWSTGDFFVGKFVKDSREGAGVLTTADGKVIEGIWKDNNLIGI